MLQIVGMSSQFEKVKRELLVKTLRETQSKLKTATALEVPYTTIYRMMIRYRIKDEEWRGLAVAAEA